MPNILFSPPVISRPIESKALFMVDNRRSHTSCEQRERERARARDHLCTWSMSRQRKANVNEMRKDGLISIFIETFKRKKCMIIKVQLRVRRRLRLRNIVYAYKSIKFRYRIVPRHRRRQTKCNLVRLWVASIRRNSKFSSVCRYCWCLRTFLFFALSYLFTKDPISMVISYTMQKGNRLLAGDWENRLDCQTMRTLKNCQINDSGVAELRLEDGWKIVIIHNFNEMANWKAFDCCIAFWMFFSFFHILYYFAFFSVKIQMNWRQTIDVIEFNIICRKIAKRKQ